MAICLCCLLLPFCPALSQIRIYHFHHIIDSSWAQLTLCLDESDRTLITIDSSGLLLYHLHWISYIVQINTFLGHWSCPYRCHVLLPNSVALFRLDSTYWHPSLLLTEIILPTLFLIFECFYLASIMLEIL